MAAVISLREVVEAMDISSDHSISYLDPDTGEVITVTEEDRLLLQEESPEELPAWQRDMLPKIRAGLESDRWLELPDRFEIHEWSIMEEFSGTQEDEQIRQELMDAVHGAGAFRAFRSAIRRLGVEQSWYQFREQAMERIARTWLEGHNLQYK
jgi:hypothetical protein